MEPLTGDRGLVSNFSLAFTQAYTSQLELPYRIPSCMLVFPPTPICHPPLMALPAVGSEILEALEIQDGFSNSLRNALLSHVINSLLIPWNI